MSGYKNHVVYLRNVRVEEHHLEHRHKLDTKWSRKYIVKQQGSHNEIPMISHSTKCVGVQNISYFQL